MKRRTSSLLVAGSALVALASLATGKNAPSIPFDHNKHVVGAEIACLDCHGAASTATSSADILIPTLEKCYACHDQKEMNWQPPSDGSSPWPVATRELIFDHAKHGAAGIECATCHANIANATYAPSNALPKMALCTDCHQERGMSTECSSCHSQVQLLRPDDHRADWVSNHSSMARGDAKTCETCHQQSYCSECHEGAALVMAVKSQDEASSDRIGPLASAHESSKVLIVQRAHDLNYRYTHGSDVRAKSTDCATCHETQSFCAACHNSETDANRLRPVWHEVANFEFYTHADFARRDIEVCASCHESSGAEPTCLKCHKTIRSPHPNGFMSDNKGSWHDDPNAVCFVCHENGSRTPGVGFCGKCHGNVAD